MEDASPLPLLQKTPCFPNPAATRLAQAQERHISMPYAPSQCSKASQTVPAGFLAQSLTNQPPAHAS